MKVSNKLRKRILSAMTEAFAETVTRWPCYDFPPETWSDDEKELWDRLDEVMSLAQKKVDKLLLG